MYKSTEQLKKEGYTPPFREPSSYSIEEHPIDQVFRDHNGYRVFWTDENEQVQEIKYFHAYQEGDPFPKIPEMDSFRGLEDKGEHVKIFKDLNEERGLARLIRFQINSYYNKRDFLYVELHLLKNANLNAGNEVYGNSKNVQHDAMHEIK